MRIFERLRERQSQKFMELDAETDTPWMGAKTTHDSAVNFQPAEGIGRGHGSGMPQTSNSPA